MRSTFARKTAALFAFVLFCTAALSAQQRINPWNQVNWPSNCADSGLMAYNWLTNQCIAVSSSVSPIVYKGAWSDLTTYATNNAVYYAGSQYVSLADDNIGMTPGSSPLSWALLLSGGGNVASVFGRTGIVTSQSGDYSFAQISGTVAGSQLPAATTSTRGGVRPDGSTIQASGDVLSAHIPLGTNTTPGLLQPDGTNCTATGGVFTCAGSTSGLSGQTPQYVPLATTATTSTGSSSFFQNSQTSGVTNPFYAAAPSANCKNRGVIFTQFGCNQITTWDAGNTPGATPRNLTGTYFDYEAWGPGGCIAECRTSVITGDSGAAATAGIFNVNHSSTSKFGLGDVLFYNWNHNCYGGLAYTSDQGCQLIYNYGGEGQSGGRFNDYIPAGQGGPGATSFDFAGYSPFGCNSPLNYACPPSPGLWMIEESLATASGKFVSSSTVDSTFYWLSNLNTDQTTLPTVTVWASTTGLPFWGPNNPWGDYAQYTFTSTTGAGLFAAGDKVVIFGNTFEEQTVITAVTGSTPGQQTITLGLTKQYGQIAVFKGNPHFIQPDNNAAHGDASVAPAVSLDGHSWIYGIPLFSSFGSPFSGGHSAFEHYNADAKSGWHTFCGSRVTQVTRISPEPAAQLEPNSCAWAPGTMVATPDLHFQKVNGIVNIANQNGPSSPYGALQGFINSINGPGANGAASGFENSNFFSQDCAEYRSWSCGGELDMPTAYIAHGHWGTYHAWDVAPADNVTYIANHNPGQTNYHILKDNIWGSDFSLDNNGFHFNRDIEGGSYRAAGLVTATVGIQSGAGDGGGNNAGISFSKQASPGANYTWLTPCFLVNAGNSTDLCLSTHGGARTNVSADYYAAPDTGLRVGALTAEWAGGFPKEMIGFHRPGAGDWGITLGNEAISDVYIGLGGSTVNWFWRANWNTAGQAHSTFQQPNFGTPSALAVVELQQANASDTGDLLQLSSFGNHGDILRVAPNGNATFKSGAILSATQGDFTILHPGILQTTATNSDLAGVLTLSSGTASRTFTTTATNSYVCTATDTSAINPVQVVSTPTTLTINGTGSDVVNYVCVMH